MASHAVRCSFRAAPPASRTPASRPSGGAAPSTAPAVPGRRASWACQSRAGPGGSTFFSEEDPNAPIRRVIRDSADRPDAIDDKNTPIWNTDWQEQMDAKERKKVRLAREAAERAAEKGGKAVPAQSSGFISFSRAGQLDDPDLDVGQMIKDMAAAKEAGVPTQIDAAKDEGNNPYYAPSGKRSPAPLMSSAGAAAGRSRVAADLAVKVALSKEELAAREAREAARYGKMINELYYVTAGAVLLGVVCATATDGFPAGLSFFLGGLGAFAYVRSLVNDVDTLTGKGGMPGAPRIVIPVILAMACNRYNALLAPDIGFELGFIPTILGFLTYKVGTTFQIFRSLQLASEEGAAEEGSARDRLVKGMESL